ncbi:MAG: hypothetical protein ACRER5_02030, partial [Pseudomonas sp.]
MLWSEIAGKPNFSASNDSLDIGAITVGSLGLAFGGAALLNQNGQLVSTLQNAANSLRLNPAGYSRLDEGLRLGGTDLSPNIQLDPAGTISSLTGRFNYARFGELSVTISNDLVSWMSNATLNTQLSSNAHVTYNGQPFTLKRDNGSLGTTSNAFITILRAEANDGNVTTLETRLHRASNGATHTSSENRLQRRVDTTDMGYLGFPSDAALTAGWSNGELLRLSTTGSLSVPVLKQGGSNIDALFLGSNYGAKVLWASNAADAAMLNALIADDKADDALAALVTTSNNLQATNAAALWSSNNLQALGSYALATNATAAAASNQAFTLSNFVVPIAISASNVANAALPKTGGTLTGAVSSTATQTFRLISNQSAAFQQINNTDWYLLKSALSNPTGTFDSTRPIRVKLTDGNVELSGSRLVVSECNNGAWFTGAVGVNTGGVPTSGNALEVTGSMATSGGLTCSSVYSAGNVTCSNLSGIKAS